MKKIILLSIILNINLFSRIIQLEPEYEFISISMNPNNIYGEVSGFEIKNDTIYVCGYDNPLNILDEGGFYSYIKMSPDLGKTWNILDSTFYTPDNIDYLDLYFHQFISKNKLFYFTDEDSLAKTTDYGISWIKHELHEDINDYMWTVGHLKYIDSGFIFSSSEIILKSFDDGYTWEKQLRVLPDPLDISYYAEDMQLLNDSTEYIVLTENSPTASRNRFLMIYDLKNNLPISIKPLTNNLHSELHIVSHDAIYMREIVGQDSTYMHTSLLKSTNNGDSWETLFVDSLAEKGFTLKENRIVTKNGIIAFALGKYVYVSQKQSDDFYRITNPGSTNLRFVDIDSKGNIYAANFQLTSYYKFSNPFTSVQDNNPVREQSIEIMVYPNPVSNILNVEFYIDPAKINSIKLGIYDYMGRELSVVAPNNINFNNSNGKATCQIPVENISPGYYFLRVTDGKKTNSKPIIIE